MDYSNPPLEWLNYTLFLIQRLCVVVTAAFASIRLNWLRRSLRGADTRWRYRLIATAFFATLAIIGTHSGFVFDVREGGRSQEWLPLGNILQEPQAIVGFRDAMVLAAGLIAGPWVGLGTGVVAAGERYLLGGFSAAANSAATLLIGVIAGLVRRIRPRWCESLRGTLSVALVGSILQRILVLCMAEPRTDAIFLAQEIALPVTILNILACVLFMAIVHDLDRERLVQQARQAELRAWQARVEPHFLNNTLNAIKSLVRIDPERARACLVNLGEFFNETRNYAGKTSTTLGQEVAQLRRYLDFQRLRFSDSLRFRENLPTDLVEYRVPPRCLQTLVENALTHGFPAPSGVFELRFEAEDTGRELVLKVCDNGRGIPPHRLANLGRRPVSSEHGSGNALYQLAQSLALIFGTQAELVMDSQVGVGTEVTLVLPKRKEDWS